MASRAAWLILEGSVSPPNLSRMLRALSLALVVGAAAAPAPARAERHHTVRPGQTLAAIARRYRVSVADLRAANRLRSPRLRPGQSLTIPDRHTTYVRRGETLSHIAHRMHVSVSELRRANRLRRNARIRPGQRLVMPGYTPREQLERDYGEPDHPGRVTLLRRDERREVQLVDSEGRVLEEGLRVLGELLQRNEDDTRAPDANPRLALLLARISDNFGGRPIRIVSGFRPAGGRTRESSRHTKGRATDIRVHGVPNRVVWEYCRRIDHAGCGYYPRSTFVHVDARRHRTQWVDWSRPGRRARYGTLRGPANRRRRRHMPRPRAEQDLELAVRVVDPSGTERLFEDRPGVEPQDVDGAEGDLGPLGELLAELSDQPDAIRAVAIRFGGPCLVPLARPDESPEDEADLEDDEALAEEGDADEAVDLDDA